MTKKELLHLLSEKTEMTHGVAELFLNAVIESAQDILTTGGELQLAGLGKFKIKKRPARTGRNPATGEALKIPARTSVQFKASSALLTALNQK